MHKIAYPDKRNYAS